MYCGNSKIEKKVSMILATAGVGKRMGLNYPKQFFEHKGKPLFIYPLEVAQRSNIIDEIIIATNKENVELVEGFCKKYEISKVKKVVSGGKERQDSIYNALEVDNNSDIILVQDGVRPFLKEKYIEECCNLIDTKHCGAVIGVKVKDTIKVIGRDGVVENTPSRDSLVAVHTPQGFEAKILKEAYKKAKEENFLGTDDSSLVERIGHEVRIILGDYDNVKITTIEDLEFLK